MLRNAFILFFQRIFRFKTGCIAVEGAKQVISQLRSADCLSLSSYSTHFHNTKTVLEVLRRTSSLLILLELRLILKNHCRCLSSISPASITNLSEWKIKICTSNTDPITNSLRCLLVLSRLLQLSRRVLAAFFLDLTLGYCNFTNNLVLLILALALFCLILGGWRNSQSLIYKFCALFQTVNFFVWLTKKMFRLTILIEFWLHFETAIALMSTEEVVVFATATDPSSIRKLKFFSTFLLLCNRWRFNILLFRGNFFVFNGNKIYLLQRDDVIHLRLRCRRIKMYHLTLRLDGTFLKMIELIVWRNRDFSCRFVIQNLY